MKTIILHRRTVRSSLSRLQPGMHRLSEIKAFKAARIVAGSGSHPPVPPPHPLCLSYLASTQRFMQIERGV